MIKIAAVLSLFLLVAPEWSCAFVPSMTTRQQRSSRAFLGFVVLGGTKDPNNFFAGDDASSYSRELEEIEEMGGDSFFFLPMQQEGGDDDNYRQEGKGLDDADEFVGTTLLSSSFRSVVDTVESVSFVEERYATDGKGPSPSKKPSKVADTLEFGWDGIVDEEAHLGLD